MSPSDISLPGSPELVPFTVESDDSSAALSVVDSSFSVRARAVGRLSGMLPGGVYKARANIGVHVEERYLVLGTDIRSCVRFNSFQLDSPAPLIGSWGTAREQQVAAAVQSQQTHMEVGNGSQIFVFVRTTAQQRQPGTGLQLTDSYGSLLAVLENSVPQRRAEGSFGRNWRAINIAVAPGTYHLKVKTEAGTLTRPLVAPAGWQVQVFMLQDHTPDLAGAAVFLVPVGRGFNPAAQWYRETEVARLNLSSRRSALSRKTLEAWLTEPQSEPMFGIYAGHLLLLEEEPDRALVRRIVAKARAVFGQYPDVEAIALANKDPLAARDAFAMPPMLVASWSIIIKQSWAEPDLISRRSLPAQIAMRQWGPSLWLVWVDPVKSVSLAHHITANTEVLAEQLRRLSLETLPELNEFEQALLGQLRPPPLSPAIAALLRKAHAHQRPSTEPTTVRLARNLDVPPAAVADAMEHLLSRILGRVRIPAKPKTDALVKARTFLGDFHDWNKQGFNINSGLVAATLRDDPLVRQDFCRLAEPIIRKTVKNFSHACSDIDDLTQSTFMSLAENQWAVLRKWKPENQSISSFIYRFARFRAINHFRVSRRDFSSHEPLTPEILEYLISPEPTPLEGELQTELFDKLSMRLDHKQKQLFQLMIEGQDNDYMAKFLNKKLWTIYSAKERLRDHVRKIISEIYGDDHPYSLASKKR